MLMVKELTMSPKRHIVKLTDEERERLLSLVRKGTLSARRLARAHILLQADEGVLDADIAASLHVGTATVERVRKRFAEDGLERALQEKPRPGGLRRLNGKHEAFLVALACSAPPEGHAHWTMQLLAERLVRLELVPTISDETVRRTLKKTHSSPG